MKKYIAVLLLISFLSLVGGVSGQANKPPAGNSRVVTVEDNLSARLDRLVQQISVELSENQKQRIAVVEFVDLKGNVSDFGRYLAEELITRLHQTKKFKVIERQLLNKIITEQKLSLTGIIEPSSAQKLGKLLGVDAICSGSISDLGKTLKINARLINTETGEVFSAAAAEIIKEESVCALGGCGGRTGGDSGLSESVNASVSSNAKTIRADAHFFTFEVKECLLSGTTAVCDVTITNKDKDRVLILLGSYLEDVFYKRGGGSRAFDQNNNSYSAKGAEIANGSKGSLARATLITNNPTRARIYFEGIDSSAAKFSVLEIGFRTAGMDLTTSVSVKISDVPLTKK